MSRWIGGGGRSRSWPPAAEASANAREAARWRSADLPLTTPAFAVLTPAAEPAAPTLSLSKPALRI